MIKICCTLPKPDYTDLCYEDKQKFGYLVNQLRKKGYDLKKAQQLAYYQVLNESIPFEPSLFLRETIKTDKEGRQCLSRLY